MKKIWIHDPWYNFARHYVDFCTRTCFSSVKIEGKENMPKSGVTILAPNHRLALMDALLILLLRQYKPIGFGARADIFKNADVARILNWLRIVPIARERDGLKEVSSNFEIFDEIVECLDHDTPFCLFSEGTHRPQKGMMPVKKGIFRLSRMAMDQLGKPVHIVPVGLDYEEFTRPMGKLVIRVGEPIELASYLKENEGLNDADINQQLCKELHKRVVSLIDRYPERNRKHLLLRSVAAILSLPLFVPFAICSFPIWLSSYLILRKMKDKAWVFTVLFACRFFFPIFWPFWWVYALLYNFYDKIIEDFKSLK